MTYSADTVFTKPALTEEHIELSNSIEQTRKKVKRFPKIRYMTWKKELELSIGLTGYGVTSSHAEKTGTAPLAGPSR